MRGRWEVSGDEGDRLGNALVPGDPVIYLYDQDVGHRATVLRVLDDRRFLIQLDPGMPRVRANAAASVTGFLDQIEARMRQDEVTRGTDLQDAFEVYGEDLEKLAPS